MTLAYALVFITGVILLAIGLVFQLNKQRLKSDPVLIAGCYAWGGLNLLACYSPELFNALPIQ